MDSYSTIAAIACDPAIGRRVAACLAQQGRQDAEQLAWAYRWLLAAQPGWAAAWDEARGSVEGIGDSAAVISDGMILAAVQAVLSGR